MDAILYISSHEHKEGSKEYLSRKGLDCTVVVWDENEEVCKTSIELTGTPSKLPCLFYLTDTDIEKYDGTDKIEKFLEEYSQRKVNTK